MKTRKKSAQLVCPFCRTQQTVTIPENQCMAFYNCTNCKKLIQPKENSCCVICDYSNKKCSVSRTKK
ncbi:MAG: GDCCVxC domain-containing (seleno)protein [Candidatus Diapherotrites archaeon]|nr:GDCCVxC domain-containing (seleno)protein [Candidatus Diapherotrites archaeon]